MTTHSASAAPAAPEPLTEEQADGPSRPVEPIVNDLVLTIATSNGTGSQSANLILLRTIFHMGVPVGGKNLFPSNIQGLPTWFTIRANKHGWTARRGIADIFVAMNPESVEEDIASLHPGSILILNEDLKNHLNREDLVVYTVPFSKLVVPVCPDAKLRRLVINMLYVGVVAWLVHLDLEELDRVIKRHFRGKPKAAELNTNAVMAGYQWAAENLVRDERYQIQRMNENGGQVLMEGNHAAALGLLYGGISVLAWYPITPSSSLCETLIDYLHKYRMDPETGKATFAAIQAEDELASMALVVGAGWTGARAATATSGPGISLMAELTGLSYFTEIPAVIIDVQRMGPSTGLPTRTSQGDILKAYLLSHGDCKHPLLIPATMEECYEHAMLSLDLAQRLQTTVFVMLDLDLGMNTFRTKPFSPPTEPLDRGKVLTAEQLDQVQEFARYRDVDGDGIPYRTLPGTRHMKAAFFTRGTGHTDKATYSERPHDWSSNLERLARKFDTARTLVPAPVLEGSPDATIALLAYGSTHYALEEARDILAREHGVETEYLRMRGLPANGDVETFLRRRERIYVIEQNRDAQMASLLRMEYPELAPRIRSVLHYNGLPIDAAGIVENLLKQEPQASA